MHHASTGAARSALRIIEGGLGRVSQRPPHGLVPTSTLWWGGMAANLLSAAVLMLRGRQESTAMAPLNAVSQWVFGEQALRQDDASLRHTATGAAIHAGSSLFWAALYDLVVVKPLLRRMPADEPLRTAAPLLVGAAAVATVAAVTDLKLVPERLTPGFQHRLSHTSLALTYAAFGVGLAIGGLLQLRARR